jgi:MFS family permease
VVALLAVTVSAGSGFVARERACGHPMLDLGLFGRAGFSLGVASALAAYLVTFGVLLVSPYLFERALAFGPGRAGLDLMVMPLALGAAALVAGHHARRVGLRARTTLGLLLVAATLGVLAFTAPSAGRLLGALAVVGVGLGLFTPANNAAILAAVPRDQSGEVSGVVNVARGMGTALGLALTGLVFALGGGDRGSAPQVVAGYHDAITFLAAVALVAALLAWAREPPGHRPPVPDETVPGQ